MKKKSFSINRTSTLLLVFFLLGGMLYAQGYVTVSGGATTAAGANGTYYYVGTTNIDGTDRAYYDMPASVYRLEYRYNSSPIVQANEWEVWESTARGGGGTIRFYNSSSAATVPTGSWSVDVGSGHPVIALFTNSAPVLASIEGTTLAYKEGDLATAITGTLAVSDDDDTDMESASVQITSGYQSSEDVLSFTNQNGISGSWSSSTGKMSLSGTSSKANYQTALQSVKYANSNTSTPNTTTRTVSFIVNDGTDDSNTETRNISVTDINDPPTLTATGTDPTFTEDGSAKDLFSTVSISTIEGSQTITTLKLTVTNVNDGSNEELSIDNSAVQLTNGFTVASTTTNAMSVSVSVVSTTATVTISKGAGIGASTAEQVVDNMTYYNGSNTPNTSTRDVTLTYIQDNGGTANSGDDDNVLSITSSVAVQATNDPPVLDNSKSPALTGIIEDLGAPTNGSTANSTLVSAIIDNGGSLDNYSDPEGDSPGIAVTGVSQGTLYYSTDDGTNWTALGGTVSSSSALLLSANGTTRVYFKPDASVSGSINALSIKAWDGTSGSNGSTGIDATTGTAFSTASDDVSVNITDVNNPPTLTATGTDPTFTEDGSAQDLFKNVSVETVESTQKIITLKLTVSNVNDGSLERLSIDNSTVQLTNGYSVPSTSTNGMAVSVSMSSTTATVTISKSAGIDSIAARILVDGITYQNTSNNPNTSTRDVTLTYIQDNGGTSNGGDDDNVLSITSSVTVQAVNDAPGLDNSKSPVLTGIAEDLAAPTDGTTTNSTLVSAIIDNGGSLDNYSDAEGDSPGIAITAVNSGTIYYSVNGGTNWTALGGTVSNTSALVLSANGTTRVYFKPDANISGTINALTIKAWDGTSSSNGSTGVNTTSGTAFSSGTDDVSVTVSGSNDDPTISGLPASITVIEDVASNVDLSSATFGDVDAGSNSIKLSIKAGAGTMSVAAAAGLSFNGNATDSITITGTVSNIDTYLNTASNILYTSASNANGNNATTLTLIANDGGYTGTGGGTDVSLGTVNVNITAVNDPPVVENVFGDSDSEITAGSGAQDITDLNDATVSNVDSPDYNGGFLTITQGSGTANGSFGVDGTTATSGDDATIAAGETIAVGGTSVGTVHATIDGQGGNNLQIDFNTANSTSARIQTLIRSFTYSAPSGLGARVFTITLNDNDGTANSGDEDASGNITITVTPNPPIISNLDGDSTAVSVGGAAGFIDEGSNATVTDADSPNFNGGTLTVSQNTGTANGNFSVSGSGSSGVASGTSAGTADQTISSSETIYVDGVAVASVSSSDNGQSGNDLTLNFGSNATPARTQQVIRSLKYAAPSGSGDRTFTLTIVDAGSNSASGSADFKITVLPPEMDLKQGTVAIADGGNYIFSNKALNSNTDVTFTIHNTAEGTLSITTPLSVTGADAGQFSIQSQPSTTVSALDSTTFTVRFTPTSNGTKTGTISIINNDTNENPYDLYLTGSGNTPPTGADDEITIFEDQTYTFSKTDFTFSDADSDTLTGIQLQSLETDGALTYNGVDAVTSVDYPDLSKLQYSPGSNENGSPYATFTFKLKDSNNGYSTASYTMTINVLEAPDIPLVITNKGFTILEGGTHKFTDGDLKSIDNDGPSYPLVYDIISPPLHGKLVRSGITLPVNESDSITFTQNDIANEELVYMHDGSEETSDSITFVVQDSDGNLSVQTTYHITIKGLNDSPVIGDVPAITMNEDETMPVNTSLWINFISDADNLVATLTENLSAGPHLSLNQVDATHWEIIPEENYFGITNITLTVSDDSTSVNKAIQVTVQPVNDLPQLVNVPDSLSIAFGGNTSFAVSGTDLETPSNLLKFSIATTEGITANYDSLSGMVSVTAVSGFSGESLLTISVTDTDGGESSADVVVKVGDDPTGLERIDGLPEDYTLFQNYPNPFNPSTTIRYGIPVGSQSGFSSKVTLRIYDILGNEVTTLVNQNQTPGYYEYKWNASNIASGIYFYVLNVEKFREVHKMILLK